MKKLLSLVILMIFGIFVNFINVDAAANYLEGEGGGNLVTIPSQRDYYSGKYVQDHNSDSIAQSIYIFNHFNYTFASNVVSNNRVYLHNPFPLDRVVDSCHYEGPNWVKIGERLTHRYLGMTNQFNGGQTITDYYNDIHYIRYDNTWYKGYEIYDVCRYYDVYNAYEPYSSDYIYKWERYQSDFQTEILYVPLQLLQENIYYLKSELLAANNTDIYQQLFTTAFGFIPPLIEALITHAVLPYSAIITLAIIIEDIVINDLVIKNILNLEDLLNYTGSDAIKFTKIYINSTPLLFQDVIENKTQISLFDSAFEPNGQTVLGNLSRYPATLNDFLTIYQDYLPQSMLDFIYGLLS